jgi:signal transduction histidine kinase
MMINQWLKKTTLVMMLIGSLQVSAQTPLCKDTAEHRRLEATMWAAGGQNDPDVLYSACKDFHKHVLEEKDMYSVYQAWICGVMFNLGRMNIRDAYLITRQMGEELSNDEDAAEERYFVPNMLGHVYSTCGNISGAKKEFLKAAREIKGTKYEADGLAFIYLALAHAQLDNDLYEAQRWVDRMKAHLERNQNTQNYYRAKADAYAMEAIIKFKQHDIPAFRRSMAEMEDASGKDPENAGDIFLPYARIYQTLIDGHTEEALKDAETLNNEKELYLVKCDIYNYIGDKDKAFQTQQELMYKRDSITGIMIIENLETHAQQMSLMKQQAKMQRRTYLILMHAVFLAILAIVLLSRNIFMRKKYQKELIAQNQKLETANKLVTAADEMKMEFIRNVSHEIRTPLNIINGFSQVLTDEENEFEPHEQKALADAIGENTRQITSLVNKMLMLANDNTTDLLARVETVDAVKVCEYCIKAMPKTDPEKVKVEFKNMTQPGKAQLCTNSNSLVQMLGNILENAAKFTEKGLITLKLMCDHTHFRFTVEDTGCGVPDDKVNSIFERFVKADEFKEGLGLGLAYCHETVKKLGGSLVLDYTSEAGSSFTLSLPMKVKR